MDTSVIVYGSPVDGLQLVGPFETSEAAVEFATAHINDTWWVADVMTTARFLAPAPDEEPAS